MTLAEAVAGASAAVAADPANALVPFTLTATLVPGTETQVVLRARKHEFRSDEAVQAGGTDRAPNPVELALAGIGSGLVVTYQYWAAKLGLTLTEVSATVSADLDVRGLLGLADGVRAGFEEIRVEVDLRGPESAQRYAELRALAESHCPALDLARGATPVTVVAAG
jgi:uncharacterized OsmC-like protein